MSFQHSEYADDPARVEIRDAATVMIVREAESGPEVLMVQRGARLAFGARAWVFPGGRVDVSDRVDLDRIGVGLSDRDASARHAEEKVGVCRVIDVDSVICAAWLE